MKSRTLKNVLMVLICAGIAIAFFSISPDEDIVSTVKATPVPSLLPVPEIPNITYTNKGFSPSTISVKVGNLLRITNGTTSTIQIESNPHPAHTDNPELNAGSLSAGGSRTLTTSTKGTFKIHNDFNPAVMATVTIQ